MNKLFDLNISKEKLMSLGATLGADVVPCMVRDTIVGKGIGEQVTYVSSNSKYYIVIIKPKKISCNTKEMFRKYDEMIDIKQKYNTGKVVEALEQNDIEVLGANLYNVFEETLKEETIIFEYKKLLLELGANGSLMTGSGSCVFGIFKDKEKSRAAYQQLKENYEVYYSMPYHSK